MPIAVMPNHYREASHVCAEMAFLLILASLRGAGENHWKVMKYASLNPSECIPRANLMMHLGIPALDNPTPFGTL